MHDPSNQQNLTICRSKPRHTFASRTSASRSSASFFDMIDAVTRCTELTVEVTSRVRYMMRSAGQKVGVCCAMKKPMSSSASARCMSAGERSMRRPGTDSSLSTVPPV